MKKKKALITGITGQDGAYLARLLLEKGYRVHGVKRRSSSFNTGRIEDIYVDPHTEDPRFHLHYGDMTDSTNLIRIVQETKPDEIYNLAAQSHVQVSFETPEYTANADAIGTLRLLEAIRILGMEKTTRFYQASTSEMYGLVQEVPQGPAALHELHGDPAHALVLARPHDRNDPGGIESPSGSRLPCEELLRPLAARGGQELQRDAPRERDLLSLPDLTHPTAAELLHELEVANRHALRSAEVTDEGS